MKLNLLMILMAGCAVSLLLNEAALADAGRGSIRAAGRSEPAARAPERPQPAHAEPPRAEPAHAEPARGEPARGEPARAEPSHEEPARPEPAHVEDVHRGPEQHAPAPPPARADVRDQRNWDDHDEDARHFGGFGHGEPVHFVRGQRFHDLPPNHFHVPWHGHDYYFDDLGIFYELQPDGEYLSVQPPVGIPLSSLPDDAQPITVGPTTYYYLDGMFYVAQGNGFVVVDPPPGIVVPSLPTGASQTLINNSVVYQFDGFNYTPSIQDGVTVYTVTPS
jgi:hypothetical protein